MSLKPYLLRLLSQGSLLGLCGIFLFVILPTNLSAKEVVGFRVWASPEATRVVLDLDEKTPYKVFSLDNPERIVIDMPQASLKAKIFNQDLANSGIDKVRSGSNARRLRLVFDLKESMEPSHFILPPNDTYGYRLVLDLERQAPQEQSMAKLAPLKTTDVLRIRDFVIAIDAGHGGEDPGAVGGKYKTHEKDVVLSVAKMLTKKLNKQPGIRAIMIRNNDYYVGLRKRIAIARKQGADLFVSIHADSFKNKQANGASVYVLSEKGASSEAARWLAEHENRSDLVGGVSLEDKGDILAQVLLDLSQTANQSASLELAGEVIDSLSGVVSMHHKDVQKANFAVLKSPDVPSILVELGFLSNHKGEALLRKESHQASLARALEKGIHTYLSKKGPALELDKDWAVAMEHKVQRGETLSEIAVKYKVSLQDIKQLNSLKNDVVYVGQTIKIPKKQSS